MLLFFCICIICFLQVCLGLCAKHCILWAVLLLEEIRETQIQYCGLAAQKSREDEDISPQVTINTFLFPGCQIQTLCQASVSDTNTKGPFLSLPLVSGWDAPGLVMRNTVLHQKQEVSLCLITGFQWSLIPTGIELMAPGSWSCGFYPHHSPWMPP